MTADLRAGAGRRSPTPAEVRPANLQASTPKTYLTLSAVGETDLDHCRTAAAIERQLERIDRARTHRQRRRRVDRLIRFVWGVAS